MISGTSNTPGAEHRTKLVRERCRSSAAFASSTSSRPTSHTSDLTSEIPTLFTSLCHRGLEVIFTTVRKKKDEVQYVELVAIHARTRVIFQRIPLTIDGTDHAVVALSSSNGVVYVLTSHGELTSYTPSRADPKIHAFGKFRWGESHSVNVCGALKSRSFSRGDDNYVIMCPSTNGWVLLAHSDRVTIFDLSEDVDGKVQLLWNDKLGARIDHASLSGDGMAIALVLRGEGVGVPFPFGVRTFVMEKTKNEKQIDEANADAMAKTTMDDVRDLAGHVRKRSGFEVGSIDNPLAPERKDCDGSRERVFSDNVVDGENTSKITYKSGPFLVHSAPVSRLSFRGHGTTTSSSGHNSKQIIDEEGNDLLLTTCSSDCSVRIFSQNSWRQLMQWNSPPKSRADWVRGISAANLGDLDTSPGTSNKKKGEEKGLSPTHKDVSDFSTQYARHLSSGSNSDANINRALLGENLHKTPNPSAISSHSEPGTHAGAWIAELTFRNSFPALRLSRLSYLKSGGDDALPAHFESVAAILPPGSLEEKILLDRWNESSIEIEGIWPLWDPWEVKKKSGGSSGTVIHSNAQGQGRAPRWLGDGADLGGSHVPPSELRISSCHLRGDCINQIEMPLWGDNEFGAMEFGSPIQHVMSLPSILVDSRLTDLPSASLEFEAGSRLCARSSLDRKSIDLWWIKQGAVNLEEDFETPTNGLTILKDISLPPLPLRLPSLTMPGKYSQQSVLSSTQDGNAIASLHWWPDENFAGPPRLVILTQNGTIIVFEMPPPWSALEPPMPSYDPFDDTASRGSSIESGFGMNNEIVDHTVSQSFDEEDQQFQYEVSVTPHPDFGIGLRLEAQAQGMPAIAGSFKKHPLSGGRLPAEREGAISLGDELLSVNDISLEGIPFEKAIATVRQIGFDSFGAPLRMKFRRCRGKRSRGSGPSLSSGSRSSRRQIKSKEDESQATLEVGAESENQQEFGRIIAVVRDAVIQACDQPCPPAMLLIPWNFGKGAVVSHKMYGGALIVWAVPGKSLIKVARLEVVLDIDPKNCRFTEMGSIQCEDNESDNERRSIVKSISLVSSTEKGWLVTILYSSGNVSLLFIETNSSQLTVTCAPADIKASFRYYPFVLNVHEHCPATKKNDSRESYIFRPFSLELFGCIESRRGCKDLTIWSALPKTKHQQDTTSAESPYTCVKINIDDILEISDQEVVDFRWIRSGFADAFPRLILFTKCAAILYRRPCHELHWQQVAILFYESNTTMEAISPYDAYPHISSALQFSVHDNDERCLRSDWHPESILANICTEGGGVYLALRSHTYALYSWLAQWMNPDESTRPSWNTRATLASVPFKVVNDTTVTKLLGEDEENGSVETSSNLMAAMSLTSTHSKAQPKEDLALSNLQNSLCPFEDSRVQNQSEEFISAMSSFRTKQLPEVAPKKAIPTPLQHLNKKEKICVWVIGDIISNMPSFKGLDSHSQLSLFCVTLMKRLTVANQKLAHPEVAKPEMLSYVHGRPVLANQTSSVHIEQTAVQHTAASASFLSALMSDTQSRLLQACRPKEKKFDWETIRAMGIPFWIRSEKLLRSIAEEIAQTVYKTTKSVMDCALYYVAMRNMKKLRTIAATDRSDSGKKFFTFITDHDFRSERGRNAAEKNAYSLLRKRKYASAASFFLLAEPPMIKTALNIIKSQMNDLSLAFFVARLFEHASKSPSGPSESLTIGGGFNLSTMGGGGGFAGLGSIADTSVDTEDDSTPFCQWVPSLGVDARSVLNPRIEESATCDNCFDCIQLLWLDRPNDAMLRLAHMSAKRSDASVKCDYVAPFISNSEGDTSNPDEFCGSDLVARTNAVINFCSGPTLLKSLKPKKRVLWSSALLVSKALSHCGIDIPAIRIAIEVAESTYSDEVNDQAHAKTNRSESSGKNRVNHRSAEETSSIFDSFNVAPPQSKTVQRLSVDPMVSSIFDSFTEAPPKSKSKLHQTTDPMTSSIFDSFDASPPKPKAQPTTDPMTSSIFDSFDTAPPKPKSKPQPTIDPMTSSISDSPHVSSDNKARYHTTESTTNTSTRSNLGTIKKEEPLNIPEFPLLWNEWKDRLIQMFAAVRLLREMSRITAVFHGEPQYCSIESLTHGDESLISPGAFELLHKPCDSFGLLAKIHNILGELKSSFSISEEVMIEHALELISASAHPRRLACSVLLQYLLGRNDLAEDAIRNTSLCLMNNCETLGLSNDSAVKNADTKSLISSQWARRNYANDIFQLEVCMWLHRGGTFDLSTVATKEAVLAVRVGLTTVTWGRCHQTLDTLLKAEPDCPFDFDTGFNLWRSMKIIPVNENTTDCVEGVTSGGWEFLVDCRREEATEMLRDGIPGQFLIRPHPQDPGVFTISFRTNLVPTDLSLTTNDDNLDAANTIQNSNDTPSPTKIIKRDDVVQHAIIRLTDTGFRCGSFGPFATLTKLLQAVSGSLPFDLRFNDPPGKGVIKERCMQSSPNSFLLKKLALHSAAERIRLGSNNIEINEADSCRPNGDLLTALPNNIVNDVLKSKIGLFASLLFLTEFRKQSCAIAAARVDDELAPPRSKMPPCDYDTDEEYDGSISEGSLEVDEEENIYNASRMVRPLLNWCRAKEIEIVDEIAPSVCDIQQQSFDNPLAIWTNASGEKFEVPTADSAGTTAQGYATTKGDAMIRNCIQADSGVDFRTLRVGEPGNSVVIVLFGKQDSLKWLAKHETGGDENEAQERLKIMELMRVIEPISSSDLSLPKSYAATHPSATSRYRFIDPWEVEPLESKAGETASAAIGRGRYQTPSDISIANECEHLIRATGGLHLLGLWSYLKGGIYLTKALCSAHPSWERDAGGDLLMKGGFLMEPSPYENSIRQHLYGNSLFRSLKLPQRFLALVQVDLLDLKNVTTPSGSSSLTAYAMLRLKRKGGSAPLNHKARSLDSAITQARKISKISGPNAPASWGSIVRFRFPLPEDVDCEGKSFDPDRESLFKGPPTFLQVTVYEKKFMSDVELGGADVSLDSLGTGGQIEEWVPLRVRNEGITWFARMRISLRFELMCLDSSSFPAEEGKEERCPSVALKKIRNLSRLGAHEDHNMKNSISTPHFGNMFNMLY